MSIKNILFSAFTFLIFLGAESSIRSQDNESAFGIKITIPPIVIGDGTYDQYGYDKYGYDRYGYDRYGYDRYGYDRNGYDRYGSNGYYTNDTKYKKHDNGKHKGWYKQKKNHHEDDDYYEREDDDEEDD